MCKKFLTLIIQGTPVSAGLTQAIIHVQHSLLGPVDASVDIEQNSVNEGFSVLISLLRESRMISLPWLRRWKRKSIPGWLRFSGPIK
jgi:hypothetical protein